MSLPYAVHSPQVAATVTPFRESLAGITQRPLQRAVYSPILGRYYQDDDDLLSCVAEHWVRPVWWLEAVRTLHAAGADAFVQCGPKDVLVRLVHEIVPGVSALTCYPRRPGQVTVDEAIDHLHTGTTPVPVPASERPETNGPSAPGTAATQSPAAALEPVRTSTPPAATEPVCAPAAATVKRPSPSREQVLSELRAMYAQALEYPEDVLDEHADLEAELGVDSVKQTELLVRVLRRYDLPSLGNDHRISDFLTLGHIADLITANRE